MNWLRKLPLWAFPLVLSILLFFPAHREVSLPDDGAWYRGVALNVTQGRGLIGFDGQPIDTRPLFPVLIAAAYKSFGISTASTFLTARIFFVGNVLLIYFVGQKFFNAWVGLVSSLLVLTSVSLNVWSTYIHLDHIMPFFMILAMLLTFIAHERRDYIWFGLVGATLALGYLLKEMTVLFFPLPILSFLWLKQYRRRQNLIGLGIFLIVLILMTLPWIGYVYYNSSMLGRAAGGGGIGLISNHLNEGMVNISSPLAIAHQILNAFLNYYRQFLQSNFILAPLFILAWVSAIVRAVWYHEKGSVFLTLALLLFSPMILFQGLAGFRDRLSMLLFLLSFIALGRFLIIIGQHGELLLQTYISDRPSSRALWRGLSVFLVAAPIFIQLKWEDVPAGTMEQFLNDFNTVQFVVHENTDWKFVQEASEHNARLAGEWFVNHASPEARILAGDQLLTSTYFYAQGNFLFFNLPFDDVDSLLNQSDVAWRGQKPLFLWLQKPPWILPLETPQLKQFRLYTLLENRFLEELTKRSVNYVMTDGRSNFLTLYLLDSPNFHKVAEFGHGTVNIFEVVSVAPSRFETHSDDQIPSFLNALSEQNPDRYRKITVSFFVTGLDWTPDQLQNLLSGNFSLLNLKRLVELEDYVALRSSYGPEGIPQAIAQHEEDARVQPKNPWPYVTLGALYEANGSLERSVEAYQYALSRDPNNIIIQVRLIQAYTKLAVKTESATAYRILNEIVNQALVVTPDDDELTAAILDSVRKVGPEHFETHVVAEMVSFYERTISQQPDKRQNYWELGALYESLGHFDKAIATYQKFAARFPDEPNVNLRLARLYETQGMMKEAIAEYEYIIEIEPSNELLNVTDYVRLGRAYKQVGEHKRATVAFQEAARLSPNMVWLHLELARLYEDLGNTKEAIKEYGLVIALDADQKYTLGAYLGQGRLYEAVGELEKALTAYRTAVEQFPDTPVAYLRLAKIYEIQGQVSAAVAAYEQSLNLSPPATLRQQAQRRLEELTKTGN